MKILFDICHPAQVHYFRNAIKELEKRHSVIILIRDKDISLELAKAYGLKFISMGKNYNNLFGKILYFIICEIKTAIIFLRVKPDIAVSFASAYIAHNCFIFRKTHIVFDDTEHAYWNRILYRPFSDLILTPSGFKINMGPKHIKFKGQMEDFYLNSKYFKPNIETLKKYKVFKNDNYCILRFISWNAMHDTGEKGLSMEFKYKLVNELKKYGKVLISSEGDLPDGLSEYRINSEPENIHNLLFYSNLYIGEGATMASESAILGTYAIYTNSLRAGTLDNLELEGKITISTDENTIMQKAINIFEIKNDKTKPEKILTNNTLNLTDMLIKIIDEYPVSIQNILKNKLVKPILTSVNF